MSTVLSKDGSEVEVADGRVASWRVGAVGKLYQAVEVSGVQGLSWSEVRSGDAHVVLRGEGPGVVVRLSVGVAREQLGVSVSVTNTGNTARDLSVFVHTPLAVPDISDIVVNNLPGQQCHDVELGVHYTEQAPMLSITEPIHRVYKDVPAGIPVQVVELGYPLHTVWRKGLPDMVLRNPWTGKGWEEYLEVACGWQLVTVGAGESVSGSVVLVHGGEIDVRVL